MKATAVTGTRFQSNLGLLTIDTPINYGGTTTTYRARCAGRWVVLEFVDEDSRLDDQEVADEVRRRVRAYAALLAAGVPVPRLLDHDVSRGYLVKEYLAGNNVGDTLTRDRLGSGVVDQFGALTRLVKQQGLTIDWSPSNFIVVNGALHYTPYEATLLRQERTQERRAAATSSAA
jgi:TP53 regulating kinase and related kinases